MVSATAAMLVPLTETSWDAKSARNWRDPSAWR
jgi:hypothetical protein